MDILNEIVNSFSMQFPSFFELERMGSKESCINGIDRALLNDPEKRKAQRMSKARAEAKLMLDQYGDNEEISDSRLLKTANILTERNRFISYWNEDGKRIFIESNNKGTNLRYWRDQQKIKFYTDLLSSKERETATLTITCNPKIYDNRRALAWKWYKEELSEILKNIQKHQDGLCLAVVESTYAGWPHAHILLSFPKGGIKGYDKMKARNRLFYGKLYNYVKRRVKSQVFYLEVVKGKKVKNYLSKYMYKGMTVKIENIALNNGELQKEDRKFLLSYCYSVVYGARLLYCPTAKKLIKTFRIKDEETLKQFGLFSRPKVKYGKKKVEKLKEITPYQQMIRTIMDDEAPDQKRMEVAALARRPLIKYSATFPCSKYKDVKMLPKNWVRDHYGTDKKALGKYYNLLKPDFEKKEIPLSCSGCISWELNCLIKGDPSCFDDWKYIDGEGVKYKLFGKAEKMHDFYWMHTFIQLLCYLNEQIFLRGRYWCDIMQDRKLEYRGSYVW